MHNSCDLHFHNHDVYGSSKSLHEGCARILSVSAPQSGERFDLRYAAVDEAGEMESME